MDNFVALSNDELQDLPKAHTGDEIDCNVCGEKHVLLSSRDSNGLPSEFLLYYRCGNQTYLGAVAGKLLVKKFAEFREAKKQE